MYIRSIHKCNEHDPKEIKRDWSGLDRLLCDAPCDAQSLRPAVVSDGGVAVVAGGEFCGGQEELGRRQHY